MFGLNNNSKNEQGLSNNDNIDSFSSGKTDSSEEIKDFKPTGNDSLDKEMMESLRMLDNPLEN